MRSSLSKHSGNLRLLMGLPSEILSIPGHSPAIFQSLDKAMDDPKHGVPKQHLPQRLKELAQQLISAGPLKMEKATRRVRVLFDGIYLADSTSAYYVWEKKWYPYYYLHTSRLKEGYVRRETIDKDESVSWAIYKGPTKSLDALMSTKGKLAGLTRFEFRDIGL